MQLFLLSAIWGGSFLLISVAAATFSPIWVALLRLAFGAAFLWLVLRLGQHRLPSSRLLGPLLLVALFNNVIPFTFFAWGEQTVSSTDYLRLGMFLTDLLQKLGRSAEVGNVIRTGQRAGSRAV